MPHNRPLIHLESWGCTRVDTHTQRKIIHIICEVTHQDQCVASHIFECAVSWIQNCKLITCVMNQCHRSQLISFCHHHHHHLPVPPTPLPICGQITSNEACGSECRDVGWMFPLLFGTDDSIQNPGVAGATTRDRVRPHICYVFSLIPLPFSFVTPHRLQKGKGQYADHLQTWPCPCPRQPAGIRTRHNHDHASHPRCDSEGGQRGQAGEQEGSKPLPLVCTWGKGGDPTAVLILPTLPGACCTQDEDGGIPPPSSSPACFNHDAEPHCFFQCHSLPLLIYVVSLNI